MDFIMKKIFMLVVLLGFQMSAVALAAESEQQVIGSILTEGMTKSDYAKKAKITVDTAKKTALRAAKGQVKDAALEDEDGYLVYAIEVAMPSGTEEIVVDAGNGKILAHHKYEAKDDEDGEENDD